jgi:hypothetical protein
MTAGCRLRGVKSDKFRNSCIILQNEKIRELNIADSLPAVWGDVRCAGSCARRPSQVLDRASRVPASRVLHMHGQAIHSQ